MSAPPPHEPPDVPASLRRWITAQAVVDLALAVALLVAPRTVLGWLHWAPVDPVCARLAGAALLALGFHCWRERGADGEAIRRLLDVLLIWSAAVIAGLVIEVGAGAPDPAWALLAIFIAFFGVWTHHRIRMKQLASALARFRDDPDELDEDIAEREPASDELS